jgi:hypothetical protein
LAWNTTHPLQRAKTAIAHGDPFNPTASLWSVLVAERQMENTSSSTAFGKNSDIVLIDFPQQI